MQNGSTVRQKLETAIAYGEVFLLTYSSIDGVGSSTVERWYQDFVAYRVKELEGRHCPSVLGIDDGLRHDASGS